MSTSGTYFKRGSWNAVCDRCGVYFKAEELRQDWQGLMLCADDWEPRHPQDFVRARTSAEPAPVPFTRSPPTPSYVLFCTPNGRTAVPGLAVPGCAIPSFIDPANTLEF